MAKQSAFLAKVQKTFELQMRKANFITRQQTLDKVTIALGQLGYSPDEIAKFEGEYCRVEDDYCDEVIEDGNVDETMEYAKDKIDRVLKQYVRPDRFTPYEERYKL